ncbi:MAG TPA: hypothetical protein VFG55_03590, partial [Rhodanobacteraceae bacterium]|nr:hypothetical protein [Rhodanobacteraceae bacterium]
MNAAPLLSLVLAASAAGSVEPSNAPAIDDRGAATIAGAGTPNDPGFDDAALQQRAQARFAAYQTWQSDLYDALAASAEPLDWALASRLYLADANRTTVPLRPTRDDLLDLAIGRAPDDVFVQWFAATDRIGGSACEARPSADEPLANLKRLESDNAAIWLLALDVAVARHDAAAVDDAVIRMAASTR